MVEYVYKKVIKCNKGSGIGEVLVTVLLLGLAVALLTLIIVGEGSINTQAEYMIRSGARRISDMNNIIGGN